MKYYKVYMSNKTDVVLDENDYQKLLAALNSGSFVKLRKAIINPSFIMMIQPIPPKDALELEARPRKIEGYIDEESGVYVVIKDEHPVVTELRDEFSN
jgi:hypothetical protein